MSQETGQWLNTMTLIGATDKRGNAWHYRAEQQGAETNHYPGFIPVEDVKRRLFFWKPVEGVLTADATILTPDGVEAVSIQSQLDKAIIRPPRTFGADDAGAILGIFKGQPGKKRGYKIHDYEQWLLTTVGDLLDDELGVTSAGLLKGGAIAWVEVSVPETIETPSGVKFRPNLLAGTSLDGSLATTFKRTAQNTVCDNTMAVSLRSEGGVFKVKHSRNSLGKLQEAREAVEIVHTIADDFTAEVEQLTNTTVTDAQFDAFLASLTPVPEKEGRGKTMAENKQGDLRKLWNSDPRVAPWKDTAWGVVQAVNTYEHHIKGTRGADKVERNAFRAVTGGADKLDAATKDTLNKVLAAA
jgi:phage/plasmid-like protein (TIGR03299 family)